MTVGSIISGGFRLIREHPGAVAVWALLYLVVTVAMSLAMGPIFGASAGLTSGDPQLAAENMMAMMGRLLLIELLVFIVMVVLFAATQRAVLQPQRRGFAYLRLGMDELRLFGLAVFLLIIFYIGFLLATLVLALVVGLFAVAVGPATLVPLALVGTLAMFALVIWFQVRLSLAFPLTLLRGTIVIGEAWRLSRSRFWSLFGAFLVIFLLMLAMWLGVFVVTSGAYFADLASSGFTPEGIQAAGRNQMARQFGEISVMGVVGWLLSAIAGSLAIALYGGAVATAARELVVDVDGLSETFA